jgi:hypothetical protein
VGLSTLCQALETGGGGSEAVDGGGRAQRPCESVIYLISSVVTGASVTILFSHLPFIVTSSPVLSASLTRALYEPSTDPAAPGFQSTDDEVLGPVGLGGHRGRAGKRTGVREGFREQTCFVLLILEVSQTELVKSHNRNW